MMLQFSFSPDQIAMFLVLILIYGVFLAYQLFKRKEKLHYLAYLAATIPFAYLWVIGMDYLEAVFYLVLLWTIPLARDLVFHYTVNKKKGESDFANSILLYVVSVGILMLFAAILPPVFPDLKTGPSTQEFYAIIWLPKLDLANPFINPFRLLLTIDIFLMIIPMIYEIKSAEKALPVFSNILLAIIFALPTIYVIYIWILTTEILFIIGLLIGVLYFIVLLSLTKGK